MTDPDTATTVGDFSNVILRTTDGGVNWGLQSSGIDQLAQRCLVHRRQHGSRGWRPGIMWSQYQHHPANHGWRRYVETADHRLGPGSVRGFLHRREHGLGGRRRRHHPAHHHRRRATGGVTSQQTGPAQRRNEHERSTSNLHCGNRGRRLLRRNRWRRKRSW